jgi:hypothetical protein
LKRHIVKRSAPPALVPVFLDPARINKLLDAHAIPKLGTNIPNLGMLTDGL